MAPSGRSAPPQPPDPAQQPAQPEEPGQPEPPDLPVVIVGAGPTGLVMALLLARYGVRSIVLERRGQIHPLPRAVHLDDEVLRILQQAGVADAFLAISRPALGLRLLDAAHRTMAEFGRDRAAGDHGYPQANMFDQPALEALLRTQVARTPEIDLREGWEVTALTHDPLDVTAHPTPTPGTTSTPSTGPAIRAAAVLGCDGAGSTIRTLIGSPLEDLHFRERWFVVDARSDRQLDTWNGVHQICDPTRAATYMQVGPDRYRWEFRLRDDEQPAALATPQVLGELLHPWTGRHDLTGLEIVRGVEYTFRALLARGWRQGRVFLLGDAAHQTPPFIGQGMGAGLRDAANLSWKLAAVLTGTADDDLLASYEPERSPHARALIKQAVLVGWAMTGGQGGAAWVRRHALEILVSIPGVTTTVLDRGTPPLRGGGLVAGRGLRRRSLAGRLIPQPDVVLAGGRQHRLDDVLGPGFSVVSQGPAGPQLRRFAQRLSARVIELPTSHGTGPAETPSTGSAETPSTGPAETPSTVTDPSGTLAAWLAAGRAAAVVVRPDRVVLAATDRGGLLSGSQLRSVVRCAGLVRPRERNERNERRLRPPAATPSRA